MSELRQDPIQKQWVVISAERGKRPRDFQIARETEKKEGFCPFCPEHEDRTPMEIMALRHPGSYRNAPGWDIRVVPNLYPALMIEGQLDKRALGPYDRMRGVGAHEVVIETPAHDLDMADMPVEHIARIVETYRLRWLDLSQDHRFRYILVFRNHGAAAGASLAHPHSQIIATPVTPKVVATELESAKDHFHLKNRCLFCDILDFELDRQDRIITTNDNFVSFLPYASRFPFEMTIMPRFHSHSFALMDQRAIVDLATILKDSLLRLKLGLKDVAYNMMLHTVPNVHSLPKRSYYWDTVEWDFHWHIEIFPRLTRVAGFEWGTGFFINPTPPEDAAVFLRDVFIHQGGVFAKP